VANKVSDSGFHFMQDYIKCQQYFYWRYVKQLQPVHKPSPLIYGGAIHAGLEAWYKGMQENEHIELRLKHMLESFKATMQEDEAEYAEHEWYEKDHDRGLLVLQAYAEHYPKEPFKVLAVEEPVDIELPTGDHFTGTMDLIVEQEGRVLIYDHKTTGWSMELAVRSLSTSDQATGYTMIHNYLHPDRQAVGLVFNMLRNVKSVIEFSRSLVVKSRADQERFNGDVTYTLSEIARKLSNPEERWVRNTGNCFAYNRACPFLELCQGANFEGLIGVKYKVGKAEGAIDE